MFVADAVVIQLVKRGFLNVTIGTRTIDISVSQPRFLAGALHELTSALQGVCNTLPMSKNAQ